MNEPAANCEEQSLASERESFFVRHEWTILGLLAVFTFCIGCVGFREVMLPGVSDGEYTWWDVPYASIKLFIIDGPDETAGWPLYLQLMRAIAPVIVIYTAVKAVWSVAGQQVALYGLLLRVVYRAISTHLIHKVGLPLEDGATGAVTLIQRFGSALNLNIHFHILFLDGVYVYRDNRPPRFQRVKAPDKAELEELVQLISQRVGRCLERQGLLEQDTESAWLELEPAEDTDA
jgi:hypothetical protein